MFCGFEDDRVATGDGGADLPCPHEQWEIPWDDLGADANLGIVSMVTTSIAIPFYSLAPVWCN